MSHEIMELDNVMLGSGLEAWHGLGTIVAGQPDSATALRVAGLDWGVDLEQVLLSDGNGGTIKVPNGFAIVRDDLDLSDPRRVLGSVTGRYHPVTNREAFEIADALAGEGGARFETAGSLRNGKICWMLARMPET